MYLGVIALVLAGVAVIRWWRLPMVVALAVTAVVAVVLSYQTRSVHPVQDLINHHGLGTIEFLRMRTVLGLPIGVLAGLGLETMLRGSYERHTLAAYWISTAIVAAFVGLLLYQSTVWVAPTDLHRLRIDSLIWPLALVLACVVAGALLTAGGRRRGEVSARMLRGAAVAGASLLAGAEGAFLLFSGVGINSYSHSFYPETPAISRLKAIVGNGLVGLDTGNPSKDQKFEAVGFYPEVNLGYGIALYGGHDPLFPQSYFTTWKAVAHSGMGGPGLFLPDIDSASLALRYGIEWILQAPTRSPVQPPGTRYVATLAGERLYSVPGAARFGFVGTAASRDHVISTSHPVSSSWEIRIHDAVASELVLRVTDVPGWHATIDGHPVALRTPDGLMMQVAVGPGDHTVRLWYLPGRLVQGLVLALVALLVLLSAAVFWAVRARRTAPGEIELDVGFGEAMAFLEAQSARAPTT